MASLKRWKATSMHNLLSVLFVTTLFTFLRKVRMLEDAVCFGALDVDLPVRYLHIQLRNDGRNLTESQGALNVIFDGKCHFRWEQVDNFDGSYVLRIKLWTPCERLTVTIKSPRGFLLCKSPIKLQKEDGSPLYPEFCDCAKVDVEEWMRKSGCPSSYQQLDSALSQWKTINFAEVADVVLRSWGHPNNKYSAALCHYQIINNEIYRRCFGEYIGFRVFVDEFLTSIARKMRIPHTEFIFNLGDWPLQKKDANGVPIISWCGSKDTMDIVMPTYELTRSVVASMHTVALDMHTAKGKVHWAWQDKKPTAVFRGRDSSQLRLDVASLSAQRPDLLDAGITRYFFFNESLHTPTKKHIPFSEFFKHRYVLSIDGTVAAYRFPFLLAGDSVIFKSHSNFYEHFYAQLEEGLHYIPFTINDIVEKLEMARGQNFNQVTNLPFHCTSQQNYDEYLYSKFTSINNKRK